MQKILVVDDSNFIRDFIKQALEKKGFEVIEADDGDVAVEMIYRHPDLELVILDLRMPRMSGKEALKAMREISPDIKYVATSSDIDNEDMEMLSSMGVKAFLEKPYRLEDLYRTISSLVNLSPKADLCKLKKFKAMEEYENERRYVKREPLEKVVGFSLNIPGFQGSGRLNLKALTTDVSNTGLGIIIDYPLAPGDVLRFNDEAVHVQGTVKWIMKHESSYRAGIEMLNNML